MFHVCKSTHFIWIGEIYFPPTNEIFFLLCKFVRHSDNSRVVEWLYFCSVIQSHANTIKQLTYRTMGAKRVDPRDTTDAQREQGMKEVRLVFGINHTMPYTDGDEG